MCASFYVCVTVGSHIVCQPLNVQEAERRILSEGEETFSLSQGDKESSHPQDTIRTRTLSIVSSNSPTIAQEETKTLGHHLGNTSTEVSNTFRQAI